MYKTWAAVDEELGDDKFAHSITYYLPNRLTLDEWSKLDYAMVDAFVSVLGEEGFKDVIGFAGPIPFDFPEEENGEEES